MPPHAILARDRIGEAPFVVLGEATHGAHEIYRIRAELTKAEAGWP